MTDIRMNIGKTKFDIRACGVLRDKERVLISIENDGTQTLNGGAIKAGETTEEAVVREFLEETNLHVKVEKLMAVVENFFVKEEEQFQQIIFVYRLSLQKNRDQILFCQEKVKTQWVSIDKATQLKPALLNQVVRQKNESLSHYINRE